MTTVLVVHHDPDVADQEVDSLRRAGYTVRQCAGPTVGPCPILERRPCPIVEEADVLVYDAQYTPEQVAGDKKGWGHSCWLEGTRIAKDSKFCMR